VNEAAGFFPQFLGSLVGRALAPIAGVWTPERVLAEVLTESVPSNSSVLDIGCAEGTIFQRGAEAKTDVIGATFATGVQTSE
jgi:hypothetical protein